VRFYDPNRKPRIGFMFQDLKLAPWLNVRENLMFGHDSGIEGNEQFQEIVDLLGLRAHLSEFPSRLSGGLKERTALGRTLLGNPELLLLDEPLSSTDYIHRLEIEDYLFGRVRSDSISAIIVTHDLDQAAANADEVLILPPAGSSHRASLLNIPGELRRFTPSQARLDPRMTSVMRNLISDYEAVL
jgi:ABC-type nitrate/sulfonate/bicarbonate transport system ATPase subunit